MNELCAPPLKQPFEEAELGGSAVGGQSEEQKGYANSLQVRCGAEKWLPKASGVWQ